VLEVKVYTVEELEDLFTPVEAIVNWARACLGDEGYNLVFNNCEHFANYCTLGRHHSHQVSRVLGGGLKMSWLGNIGRAILGVSSRDSTTTTYEPDKVRVAEIEASVKVKLAGMEHERIKLYAETQMELSEFNAKMEAALMEAHVRGEQVLQQSMFELIREANVLAEQRLKLIETASWDVIRQIEGYYGQLISDLDKDRLASSTQRIPQLLDILKQYEQGTPQHTIYFKEIQDYQEYHKEFIMERMKSVETRQTQVIASSIASKEQIKSHINQLVEKRMEQIGMSLEKREQMQLTGGQPQQIAQQLRITEQNAEATV
jgi:hypothetical protein